MWGVGVCSVTRVSKHSGNTLPGVEVKDADVFIRAAGGHVLTWWIKLDLPGQRTKEFYSRYAINIGREWHLECGLWRKMLPWADCHPRSAIPCRVSSVCHCWCWKSCSQRGKKRPKFFEKKRKSSKIHFPSLTSWTFKYTHTHTCPHTHLMQRSWQPTAAYLQVGSTPMSYRVVFLTMWWERLNSVPLSVWKMKRNTMKEGCCRFSIRQEGANWNLREEGHKKAKVHKIRYDIKVTWQLTASYLNWFLYSLLGVLFFSASFLDANLKNS